MSENQPSEGLGVDETVDYPAAYREAFLGQARRLPTASPGLRAYFILPECDEILDAFLLWRKIYGE